jgi:recombination protein RecR
MAEYIESLQKLAEQFGRLQGIGKKNAMKMAFSVLDMTDEDAAEFAQAIIDAKEKIHLCPICQNLTDRDICPICADETRDRRVVCIVSDARVVISMEKVREYKGLYHVLHGVISPMNGTTPDKLKIKELLSRIDEGEIEEAIIATNPTVEGEATAMHLSRLLKNFDVKVTRLAYGVPMGSDLEYADEITLYRALEGRRDL